MTAHEAIARGESPTNGSLLLSLSKETSFDGKSSFILNLYSCVCFIVETDIKKVYPSFWSYHVVHDFIAHRQKW